MILWINGAFGSGKTSVAYELHRRLLDSFVYTLRISVILYERIHRHYFLTVIFMISLFGEK